MNGPMRPNVEASRITALLGPTNTGKTHRAIECLLGHRTGMIGLPLRLLAREVYDRVVARVGAEVVALITGEEKRVGARARYWICTVEAMPMDLDVDFVAVDEIQLSAHAERGHVFTDRLLHVRGRQETWFMGADTMAPVVRELVPTAQISSLPRMSKLTSVGRTTLGALPPRSAVVAFSMPRVYEIAERIRRRKGGAAVILGALSPRARNAQVALYESGEVQYLVATDAIGMGLNMDVEHVAFADVYKFDGTKRRALETPELAQIAGRAGRHVRDGTFGTLAPLSALSDSATFAIENHQFPAVRQLVWRNRDIDSSSIDALLDSLRLKPRPKRLRLVDRAEDFRTLRALSARADVRALATTPDRVALLWEVCQVPDFRQLMVNQHENLLRDVFLRLVSEGGRLSSEWIAHQVRGLDEQSGDIDDLTARLSFIRTWTYITQRSPWIREPERWQQHTRALEERLSDTLHDRLVQRFVDRHARVAAKPTFVARGARRPPPSPPVVPKEIVGSPFEALWSLRAGLPPGSADVAIPAESAAIALVELPDERFACDARGNILVDGHRVGRLLRGPDRLRPDVALAEELGITSGGRAEATGRLRDFARVVISPVTSVLAELEDEPWDDAARGVLYQLGRGLGTATMSDVRPQLQQLTPQDRALFQRTGIVIGDRYVYVRALAQEPALSTRAMLASAYLGREIATQGVVPPERADGRTAAITDEDWCAVGVAQLGGVIVRVPEVERLVALARRKLRGGKMNEGSVAPLVWEQAVEVMLALGFVVAPDGTVRLVPARPSSGRGMRDRRR